jgi:hypothetical protein
MIRVKNTRNLILYIPETGMMTDSEAERSIFSHVSTVLLELEATNVKLLLSTLMRFILELFVSTANALEPVTLRLVSRGSLDVNNSLFPLLVHASAFEFPTVHMQVTVSPGHTDCLSQSTEVVSTIAQAVLKHNNLQDITYQLEETQWRSLYQH